MLCLYTLVWLHLHHRTHLPCYIKLRKHLAERVSCHEAREKGYTTLGSGSLPSSMGWVPWRLKNHNSCSVHLGFFPVQTHSTCEAVAFSLVGSCFHSGKPRVCVTHPERGVCGTVGGLCRAEGSKAEAVMLSWSNTRQSGHVLLLCSTQHQPSLWAHQQCGTGSLTWNTLAREA